MPAFALLAQNTLRQTGASSPAAIVKRGRYVLLCWLNS
jgi:hypothetical protein